MSQSTTKRMSPKMASPSEARASTAIPGGRGGPSRSRRRSGAGRRRGRPEGGGCCGRALGRLRRRRCCSAPACARQPLPHREPPPPPFCQRRRRGGRAHPLPARPPARRRRRRRLTLGPSPSGVPRSDRREGCGRAEGWFRVVRLWGWPLRSPQPPIHRGRGRGRRDIAGVAEHL